MNRKTKFTITKYGFRKSRYKNQNSTISVFGDSYAFCRYVNDDKTWESYLERKIKKSVRNYGVGNFGIDQSYLKFKQTKLSKNTKLILFAFVPETISRINSFWKHYSEFGNKFGFKPIFIIRNGKLILLENPLKKVNNINQLKKKIY